MLRATLALMFGMALAGAAVAQQVPDPNADVAVARPTYAAAAGPRVVIDGGHNNFHTIDGRYAAFAALVRNDGYRVSGSTSPLTAESLAQADVLVIANARGPTDDAHPLGSGVAFTEAEAQALHRWVENGGALLLIADHQPFPAAIAPIAAAFGVDWDSRYAVRPGGGGLAGDPFTREAGTLADSPVARGEGGGQPVSEVRTFTGSVFTPPAGAIPLLTLAPGFVLIDQQAAAASGGDVVNPPSAEGRLQGALLSVGRGRVGLIGEAAWFSAQLAGPQQRPMGFNTPGAEQNRTFLLNLLRWLRPRPG